VNTGERRITIDHPWQVLSILVMAAAVGVGSYLVLNSSNPIVAEPSTSFHLSQATDHPGALFIGDTDAAAISPSDGADASASTLNGYACETANLLGWTCLLDSEAGTGYVADGQAISSSNAPYASRLAIDSSIYIPQYVVITGGGNDPAGTPTATAAASYVKAAHAAFPSATLLVVAPFAVTGTAPNASLIAALRSASVTAGAMFIAPFAPLPAEDLDAGKTLTPDGQTYLAKLLAAAIKAKLPDVSSSS
jgi:hypothetical protein